MVTVSDFMALKSMFGKSVGQPDYDTRADFDKDGVITVSDLVLLKNNFGSAGTPPVGSSGP